MYEQLFDRRDYKFYAGFKMINSEETISAYTTTNDSQGESVIVVARNIGPDNYEQSWSYTGPYARQRGLDKCLAYMGWPTVE